MTNAATLAAFASATPAAREAMIVRLANRIAADLEANVPGRARADYFTVAKGMVIKSLADMAAAL